MNHISSMNQTSIMNRTSGMDHASCIKTKAAERYLLGELLPAERDAFEEHFFECPECAGDVCAGSALAGGANAYFSQAPVQAPIPIRRQSPSRWAAWFTFPAAMPAAAAFALLTLTVYQNTVLFPALRSAAAVSVTPQVLPSAVLVPAARSALPSVTVPRSAPFFQLALTLPPTVSSGTYDCELHDSLGHVVWRVPVSAGAASDDINLLLPAGPLAAGTYEIVLRAGTGRAMDPFRFQLDRN